MSASETVWMVSPPAGTAEMAHAVAFSASERAMATASTRSSVPSPIEVALEAPTRLVHRVANPLGQAAAQRSPLSALGLLGCAGARREDLAATVALGSVQRSVGGAQQQRRCVHRRPQRGRPAGHEDVLARSAGQRPHGVRSDRPNVGEARAVHHHAELVARKTAHQAAGPARRGRDQGFAHAPQGAVARGVAGGVVDGLQLVHVAHQHGHRASAFGGAHRRALEAFLQRPPVGQPRERVLVGQARHPHEELGSADREGQLACHRLEEAHVLAAEARLARRCGGVDLAPDLVLDQDRHGHVGFLAQPLEQRGRPGVDVRIVYGVEVGDAVAEQALGHRILAQRVDLVGGIALLAGAEVAHVDDRPQQPALVLPAAHRKRGRVHGRTGLLGRDLQHLLQLVRAGRRGGHAQQRLTLAPGRAPESSRDHPRGLHAVQHRPLGSGA